MSKYINLAVPFFSQRDNTYVWHERWNEDIYDKNKVIIHREGSIKNSDDGISMACQSCNITSLCMILQYLGITDDSPDDAMKKIYERDFKCWSADLKCRKNIESATHLKEVLKKTYSINEDKIKLYSSWSTHDKKLRYSDIRNYLRQEFPIWFSWGIISGGDSGHISVIRGKEQLLHK